MRRLAPLLVLLFLIPSFSGCIGGPSVTWGASDGEYSASLGSESTSVQTVSVTNKMATNSQIHIDDETYNLASCNGSIYTLSGWLVQTKIFSQPVSQLSSKAVTSWMIKEMSYGSAQDMEPGSVYVSIVNSEKDWDTPTTAQGQESGTTNDRDEFPHRNWALVGLIPANENVFDAAIQMDTNQAVNMEGYRLENEYIDNDKQLNGCDIDASSDGWRGHFVVTSVTYGNERVASADEAYVAGDIPFFGRGLYTTILLISIVASGALYIFSRNQIILNADTQAQAMLSEQQMRAGKSARHEAARHDARMAATAKAKESEYTGKPTKKSAAATPTFDIGAALSEDTPGSSTGHYVAGSSVTSTEEAEAMQDMITEMQEEQAFEQELQEKGLRNIIGDMPKGGGSGKRRTIATKPHTSRLESDTSEPEPKKKPTRRTRKTRSTESEPEISEEEEDEETTTRRTDPEVNDEGDFSDFSL